MAKFILKEVDVTINGVNFSDHTSSVEVNLKKADVDTTNFSGGGKEHAQGLKDDEISLNLQQNFDAGEVDATLYPLFDSGDEFTVVIKPRNAAVSATNPAFTATCILLEYSPLSGKPGDLSETKVKFVTQRTGVTRATS